MDDTPTGGGLSEVQWSLNLGAEGVAVSTAGVEVSSRASLSGALVATSGSAIAYKLCRWFAGGFWFAGK